MFQYAFEFLEYVESLDNDAHVGMNKLVVDERGDVVAVSRSLVFRSPPPPQCFMPYCHPSAPDRVLGVLSGSCKMAIKDLMPWNRKDEFGDPDAFEDCVSCRVVGRSSLSLLLQPSNDTCRVDCAGLAGRVDLLLRNAAAETSTQSYRNEQVQVQVRL